MRRIPSPRLLAPLVLVALTSGCLTAAQEALAVPLAPEHLHVHVDPEESTITDDTAVFRVVVTAERPQAWTAGGCAGFPLGVTLDAGRAGVVALYPARAGRVACPSVVTEHVLTMGRHVFDVTWNGRVEQGANGAPHEGARVPPGAYVLLASVRTPTGNATGSATVTVVA